MKASKKYLSLNFESKWPKTIVNENISKHDVNISGVNAKHQGTQIYCIAIFILNISFYIAFSFWNSNIRGSTLFHNHVPSDQLIQMSDT